MSLKLGRQVYENKVPSSKRSGYSPLKAKMWVRVPLELPKENIMWICFDKTKTKLPKIGKQQDFVYFYWFLGGIQIGVK